MPDDKGTLLELYKTAVEMADRVSSRRAGANTFFLTLNTTLAAVVGIVSSARKPPSQGSAPSFDAFGLVLTAVAGILLAVVWWALLAYYRRLNGAKFDVINKLEKQLPAQPYADEWAILHPDEPSEPDTRLERWQLVKRLRRWRRRTRHQEATVIEQVVPLVFVVIYVALADRRWRSGEIFEPGPAGRRTSVAEDRHSVRARLHKWVRVDRRMTRPEIARKLSGAVASGQVPYAPAWLQAGARACSRRLRMTFAAHLACPTSGQPKRGGLNRGWATISKPRTAYEVVP